MWRLFRRIQDWFSPKVLLHVAYDNRVKKSRKLPVVFLHGIASSSDDFVGLKPKLPTDRRVVFLDLLGYGKSPQGSEQDYSLDANIRAIHATLQKLGIDTCDIVGYSMGALLAIAYSAQYGGVKHVVCCSMPLYTYEKSGTPWHKIVELLYGALATDQAFALQVGRVLSAVPQLRRRFHIVTANWSAFQRDMKDIVASYNPLQDALRLKRVTMIAGRLDPFVSVSATKQFAKDISADSVIVNHSALHMLNSDYDKSILTAIGE